MSQPLSHRSGIFWTAPVRAIGTATRTGVLVATASVALGCAVPASPVSPQEPLRVSPELQFAYELLSTSASTAAWAGTTIGNWTSLERPHLSRIVVGPQPADVRAQYDHVDTITVSPYVVEQGPEIAAAFIAHEIRHADGVRHDCADGARDRTTALGAWYVHAAVLESFGRIREAAIVRDMKFCQ